MLPIVIGLGSIAGIFCLWAYRQTGKLPSCKHYLEEMDLEHPALLDCDIALSAAVFVRKAWRELDPYFPSQEAQRFTFTIFFDEHGRRPGFHRKGENVFLNLAKLEQKKEDTLDTVVEEIHHLREEMAGIEPEFVFPQPKGLLTHEDIVKYYALNPHEYRALKAVVEIVGTRAQLLKEVEEYRALHGIS